MAQTTCNFSALGVDFFSLCTSEQISSLVMDTTSHEWKSYMTNGGAEKGSFIPKMTEGFEFEISEDEVKKYPKLYAILKNPEKNNFIGKATINRPDLGALIFNNVICTKGLQTISNTSQTNKVTIKFNK
jgi:hypothetical protein